MSEQELKLLFHTLGSATRAMAVLSILRIFEYGGEKNDKRSL